jgi:AcrR family transcriptional regulator
MLQYAVNMGRPRVHNAQTAADLLEAAEAMTEQRGVDGLSLRALAEAAGTTTRAIYSVYGSKEELLAALSARAMGVLDSYVSAVPVTADAGYDLVKSGLAFRRFARLHPSLYQLAFGLHRPPPNVWPSVAEAQRKALEGLRARLARISPAGADSNVLDANMLAFHAMCEGLATLELRGVLRKSTAQAAWRHALTTCVNGMR